MATKKITIDPKECLTCHLRKRFNKLVDRAYRNENRENAGFWALTIGIIATLVTIFVTTPHWIKIVIAIYTNLAWFWFLWYALSNKSIGISGMKIAKAAIELLQEDMPKIEFEVGIKEADKKPEPKKPVVKEAAAKAAE